VYLLCTRPSFSPNARADCTNCCGSHALPCVNDRLSRRRRQRRRRPGKLYIGVSVTPTSVNVDRHHPPGHRHPHRCSRPPPPPPSTCTQSEPHIERHSRSPRARTRDAAVSLSARGEATHNDSRIHLVTIPDERNEHTHHMYIYTVYTHVLAVRRGRGTTPKRSRRRRSRVYILQVFTWFFRFSRAVSALPGAKHTAATAPPSHLSTPSTPGPEEKPKVYTYTHCT